MSLAALAATIRISPYPPLAVFSTAVMHAGEKNESKVIGEIFQRRKHFKLDPTNLILVRIIVDSIEHCGVIFVDNYDNLLSGLLVRGLHNFD